MRSPPAPLPDSILLRIFLAHCTKASSTFSPVSALVSRNISSESDSRQGKAALTATA